MNKIKKVMNRIGFLGLFLAVFLSISCNCQNFFWSHTGTNTTPCIDGYGLLYNYYAATDTRKISSSDDWVVPINASIYSVVFNYLGGTSVAGGKLKEIGYNYWDSPNTSATNESGFNGRGSGYRLNTTGAFLGLKQYGYGWTSDIVPRGAFWGIYNKATCGSGGLNTKIGVSIRLIYVGSGTPTSYTGNDGKVYRVVKIGTQYWIADNLQETKFRNGDIIPWYGTNKANYFTNAEWVALTTAGCCAYNNNVANVGCNFQFPDY